jgi:DNA-binding YbaB/EbfC family protein
MDLKGGLGGIMQQAQQMQAQLQKAQQAMAEREVCGEAGAGLVKVTMTGRHDVRRVDVDPAVLKEDKAVLEDLLAAAVNDAVRRVEAAQQEALREIGGGLLPDGFKMPF